MKKPDRPFDDISLLGIGFRARPAILCILSAFFLLLSSVPPVGWAGSLEEVKGHGCFKYGDSETPGQAKKKAKALAMEEAVENHQVFISSTTRVENFQLKQDLIQSVSSGVLKSVTIHRETEENRKLCVWIVAQLEPSLLQEDIGRRLGQREVNNEVAMLLDATRKEDIGEEGPGLRVWLNKPEGLYGEGENLIVYVQSKQDAYLKLDYFQADRQVVHLVPNFFREQAFIKKEKIYEFGGSNSPEEFIISGPFGDETINALISTQPFTGEMLSKEKVGEGKAYIKKLKQALRGVTVKMRAATVALHTRSPEEIEHRKDLNLEGDKHK